MNPEHKPEFREHLTVDRVDAEMVFVVHIWIDVSGPTGRVTDGECERRFQDTQSLTEFINDHLQEKYGVSLPLQRAQT
jgi:hypothetical protein